MKPQFTLPILGLVLFACVLYAATLRGVVGNPNVATIKGTLDQPTKPFELSPERGRYLLTMSLAEDKSFALSPQLAQAAMPDVGYYNGKYYVFFVPGVSVLALPLYWLGKAYGLAQVGTYATIGIIATITLVLLYKIARDIFKLPVWASLVAPLVFGFASTSLSYATTLYQHHVTTLLFMLSFYAAFQYSLKKRLGFFWLIVVGTCYGYGLFIDYPNALLLMPVLLYVGLQSLSVRFKRQRLMLNIRASLFVLVVVLALGVGLNGYYNQTHFDSWKRVSGSLIDVRNNQEQQQFQQMSNEKLAKLAAQKDPIKFFAATNVPKGIYELTVAPDKGLFIFSPIFILGLAGIVTALKQMRHESAALLGLVGANLLLYSSFGDPWGGWAYGPRYLIPSMAILSLFSAVWIASTRRLILPKIVLFVLAAISSAIALVGAVTTNAVPPKIEAEFSHMHYGVQRAYDFLVANQSSSAAYNTYFSAKVRLIDYYLVLFLIIIAAFALILFVLPVLQKEKHYEV